MGVYCAACGAGLPKQALDMPDFKCPNCQRTEEARQAIKKLPTARDVFAAVALFFIIKNSDDGLDGVTDNDMTDAWDIADRMMESKDKG